MGPGGPEPSPGGGSGILREAFWTAGGGLYRLYFSLKASGLEHLPENRPYVIAANHSSHLDAPFHPAGDPAPNRPASASPAAPGLPLEVAAC